METRTIKRLKAFAVLISSTLVVIIGVGLIWKLFLAPHMSPDAELGRLGWYIFSFVSGLTMLVLPCTLPLAFVIIPLSMGRRFLRGIGIAISFGAGVAIMLSLYGAVVGAIGKTGLEFLGASGGDIKNWVYLFAGIFAYALALSELGLIKFRMPSYTGSAPEFIQRRQDYAKAFLLGMFLGNIGIGCPHPATPLLLVEIASSGDVFYGWTLFLVQSFGRVLPLFLLAFLGLVGVNSLTWLTSQKAKIERFNGWAMIVIASFILTIGLFSHDWWIQSGQYDLLQKITTAEWFPNILSTTLATTDSHLGEAVIGSGIFGQPLVWGNRFLLLMWLLPLWWFYLNDRRRVFGTPAMQLRKLEHDLIFIEEERRGIEVVLHIPEGEQGNRVKELEGQIDGLLKERTLLEEGMRYGADSGLRDDASQRYEEELLRLRRNWYLAITILLVMVF